MAPRKRPEPPEPGTDWLDELEGRVREAASRLAELHDENRALAARVEELEAAADADASDAEPPGSGAKDRARERREIRRRVESLTETLDSLLESGR